MSMTKAERADAKVKEAAEKAQGIEDAAIEAAANEAEAEDAAEAKQIAAMPDSSEQVIENFEEREAEDAAQAKENAEAPAPEVPVTGQDSNSDGGALPPSPPPVEPGPKPDTPPVDDVSGYAELQARNLTCGEVPLIIGGRFNRAHPDVIAHLKKTGKK